MPKISKIQMPQNIFNPKLGRPLSITEFVSEESVIDDRYGMFLSYLRCGVLHNEFQSVMTSPYEVALEDQGNPIKAGSLSMYGETLVQWELL
jgi:hypothetical protein